MTETERLSEAIQGLASRVEHLISEVESIKRESDYSLGRLSSKIDSVESDLKSEIKSAVSELNRSSEREIKNAVSEIERWISYHS